MKKALMQILPPVIYKYAKRVYYATCASDAALSRKTRIENIHIAHNQLNDRLEADTMMLRPGLEVRIHPDSRKAFEPFCTMPTMVDEMNCFLEATTNKEKLLDIGALHGIFSLVFAIQRPSRTVLSVDASPVAFARLLYNIHRNKLSTIEPIECAVSEKAGTLSMHYEWEHAVAAGTKSTDQSIDVEMDSGDSLCDSRGFEPDVIKIDVEGHEIKVLKGLAEIIRRCLPLIFLEIHPKRIAEEGDSISFLDEFFRELGYTAAHVSGGGFPLSNLTYDSDDERVVLHHGTE